MTKIKYVLPIIFSSSLLTSIYAHGDEFANSQDGFHGGMGHMMNVSYYGLSMWLGIFIFTLLIIVIIFLLNKKK